MLLTLNNDVRAEDEVISLPTEDELSVVVNGDLPDLVARWVLSEDTSIAELNGVLVVFTSSELLLLELLRLLVDWLSTEVDVVEMSTETTLKVGEVAATWSFNFERSSTLTSGLESVTQISSETNSVNNVTVTTIDLSDVFGVLEVESLLPEVLAEGTSYVLGLEAGAGAEAAVFGSETKDKSTISDDGDRLDLEVTLALDEFVVVEFLSIRVGLSSEELVL